MGTKSLPLCQCSINYAVGHVGPSSLSLGALEPGRNRSLLTLEREGCGIVNSQGVPGGVKDRVGVGQSVLLPVPGGPW